MTVIAAARKPWGAILCADTETATEGPGVCCRTQDSRKLVRCRWGAYGAAGDVGTIQTAHEHLVQAASLVEASEMARKRAVRACWLMTDGWSVLEVLGRTTLTRPSYAAIGSGTDVALGALHATGSPFKAVRAAIAHSPGVGGVVRTMLVRRT